MLTEILQPENVSYFVSIVALGGFTLTLYKMDSYARKYRTLELLHELDEIKIALLEAQIGVLRDARDEKPGQSPPGTI